MQHDGPIHLKVWLIWTIVSHDGTIHLDKCGYYQSDLFSRQVSVATIRIVVPSAVVTCRETAEKRL